MASPLDQNQYPFGGPGFPYAPTQPGAAAAQHPYGYGAPGPNGYGPGNFPGAYPPGYVPPQGMGAGPQQQPVRQQGPANPMQYPQGNTFQDQFLAERTPGEMARLDALSRQAAEQLGPQTILRPLIIPKRGPLVRLNTDDGVPGPNDKNAEFVLEYYFPFAAFIRKITATLISPILNDEFSGPLLASANPFGSDVSALDYIEGKLERANNENVFTEYAPLSEWCGTGQLSYVWDLIPYISRAETIRVTCRIPKFQPLADVPERYVYDYIAGVNITMHSMRFPAP